MAPEFNDPSIRELFVRNYRLMYRVTEGVAYIAFIHGARDVWLLWQREGKSRLKEPG